MCGIVGLFLKDESLRPKLGDMLSDMLITMTDRGPDSAGLAIYSEPDVDNAKITVQSDNPDVDFKGLGAKLKGSKKIRFVDTHAVITVKDENQQKVLNQLAEDFPNLAVMSKGDSVEIFKEVGLPEDVVNRFEIRKMSGTHAVGHTRMATESAVTTMGAHPFSTADDECLVHNGSLSNHNSLRRKLIREGMVFETENDTEVGAAYISHRIQKGDDLGQALDSCLTDLDGFYTLLVGTKGGFGILRDPIACKPAVLAETDQYVAFGSEYRALVDLPGIENAKVWEPEPATVYFWSH